MQMDMALPDAARFRTWGKQIYADALELQTRYGMKVGDDFCRDRIAVHEGVRVDGERVFFAPDLIERLVPFGSDEGLQLDVHENSFHFRANPPDEEGWRYRAGGFALAVYDPAAGRVRPSTAADLSEALQLCDVLGIGGHYPCSATDAPPALRNVLAHRLCLTHSRYNCTHVCAGVQQAKWIHRLHAVLGPAAQMPVTCTVVTPFAIETTNLKVIRHFVESGVPKESVRIVPVGYGLAGMNYPITLGGSWTICLAEHMGLNICARLIESGFAVAPSVGPVGMCPVDYRSMALAAGNPNQVLYNSVNHILAQAVLGRDWATRPGGEVGLWTGSPVPDGQAAAEKAAAALAGCQQGITQFGRLGNLCVDDVWSAEQMLMDMDIVHYARQTTEAYAKLDDFMDSEGLADEVQAYIEDGESFMMAPSTMKHLRRLAPGGRSSFVRDKLASIADTTGDRLVRELSARKGELLGTYGYALPADQEREMAAVYGAAAAEMSG